MLGFLLYTKMWSLYLRYFKKDSNNNFSDAYVYCNKKTDKKFFVVRMTAPIMGPGAAIRNFACVASWAEKHGFIPLLDWEYKLVFEKGELGRDNLASIFFEFEYDINSIKDNYYTIVGTVNHIDVWDNKSQFWNSIIKDSYSELPIDTMTAVKNNFEQYIKINKQLLISSDKVFADRYGTDNNVIAAMMREEFTDEGKKAHSMYSKEVEHILSYHPVNQSVDICIDIVCEMMKEKNINQAFVATIYTSTIKKFEEKIKDVGFVSRNRIDSVGCSDDYIGWELATGESSYGKYQEYREWLLKNYQGYLQEIIVASKCKYIFGNKSTGFLLSIILSKEGTSFQFF